MRTSATQSLTSRRPLRAPPQSARRLPSASEHLRAPEIEASPAFLCGPSCPELALEGRRRVVKASVFYFPKNFPTPTRTCTVLIPGFGELNPAFEICR